MKKWCKTKHRETRDVGNRGRTPELGEGQTGGERGPVLRSMDEARSRLEGEDGGWL